METKRKEIQVIMLPSNQELLLGSLCTSIRYKDKPLIFGKFENSYNKECKRQELYFVSDDEIKAMDYWINLNDNSVNNRYAYAGLANNAPSCKKIIATTDKSLKRDITDSHRKHSNTLPQPPQEFIEEYCRKGGINIVIVEYVEYKTKRYKAVFDIGDRVPIGIFDLKIIMVRKDGYYWTKRLGDWKICSFWRGSWYWENIQYDEDDFEEIDEAVIER